MELPFRVFSGQAGEAAPELRDTMRISDRYIGRQVLLGTVYAVMVLAIVLVLGRLFQEIKPLLVDQKAPLELVVRFVISVLPLSLMYTIPWGFLSAVLLVFGKLSSNQEITSFRVAGISLVRLSLPVFVIGAALSGLSLWLNLNVLPNSKATMKQLLYEHAERDPDSMLKPGVVQADFKGDGLKVLIEGKNDEWVEGFHLYLFPEPDADSAPETDVASEESPESSPLAAMPEGIPTYVHAARAALSVDPAKSQLRVKLEDAYYEAHDKEGEMKVWFAGEAEPLLIDLKGPKDKGMKANAMSNQQIRDEIAKDPGMAEKKKVKMRSEITKRYSFSMACLAFAFVAVPLGLQSRRRDTSHGLVISLLIGTGYFLLTILAEEFQTDAGATLMLWSPNIACVLLGLFLFRRARFR